MSAIEKRLVETLKESNGVIHEIAGSSLGILAGAAPVLGDRKEVNAAASALRVIYAVTAAIKAGFEREIDPKQVVADVESAFATYQASIAQNNAAIDAAADAKFGKPDAKFDKSDAHDDPTKSVDVRAGLAELLTAHPEVIDADDPAIENDADIPEQQVDVEDDELAKLLEVGDTVVMFSAEFPKDPEREALGLYNAVLPGMLATIVKIHDVRTLDLQLTTLGGEQVTDRVFERVTRFLRGSSSSLREARERTWQIIE